MIINYIRAGTISKSITKIEGMVSHPLYRKNKKFKPRFLPDMYLLSSVLVPAYQLRQPELFYENPVA
tara:strand:- start:555 stop:755 length:201 start_codon:yes stop_codon:yes gene_type:complete